MARDQLETPRPLPTELPKEPWTLFQSWLDEATAGQVQPHPSAMTLALVEPNGRPSARQVICRGIDTKQGWLVFYTNRNSRKGRALERTPHAALVFHWDVLKRQVRIEGCVTRIAPDESDRIFDRRPRGARLCAWTSPQSRAIEGRAWLARRLRDTEQRFPDEVPRPPFWGGYRIAPAHVEFWQGHSLRLHDRLRYTRAGQGWTLERLAP